MKEENNGASKNKWSRIFRKKWFFPAVYLTVAALLLTVVVWYQNLDNQVPEAESDQEVADNYTPNPYDEEAQPVVDQQEVVQMPLEKADQAEIVTKFFDYNADQEDQEAALVLYNNRYYQSTGVDFASPDDKEFNVTAALTGTVTEVKEDPLLGNLVELTHENGVTTYYASLGEVEVEAGVKVKQGDVIGTAGENLFGKDKGIHLHFEIRKDGEAVNPETFFNQPVSNLDSVNSDDADADQSSSTTTDDENATDNASTTEESDVSGDNAGTEESDATDNSGTTDDTDATDDSSTTDDSGVTDDDQSTDNNQSDQDGTGADATDGNSTGLNTDSSETSANA